MHFLSWGTLRALWRALALVLLTSVVYFGFRLKLLFRPSEATAMRRQHIDRWAISCRRLFGIRFHCVTDTRLSELELPLLVVANHRSAMDIPLLLATFSGVLLSHEGVRRWFMLGRAASEAGTIFVDRESRKSGAEAIRLMRARLEQGDNVIVFPEGTTFAGDAVRPFKTGSFRAVTGTNSFIVPVGFAYDHGAEFTDAGFIDHILRVATRKNTSVVMVAGAPFAPQGDAKHLAAMTQDRVQHIVERARRLHTEMNGP